MNKDDEKLYNDLRNYYCNVLFEYNNVKELMNMFDIIKKYIKLGYVFKVPYDNIAQVIYDSENDIGNLKEISSQIQEDLNPFSDDDTELIIKDTINYINLAIYQKEYVNKVLYDSKNSLDLINEQYTNVNDIKSKIYTDFITILGIFTAITFATFGGLQLLGNVYGNANTDSLKSIGGIVFLGANYLFGVYLILIILLTGIKKLTSGKKDYVPSLFVFWLMFISCLVMLAIGVLIYWLGCKTEV